MATEREKFIKGSEIGEIGRVAEFAVKYLRIPLKNRLPIFSGALSMFLQGSFNLSYDTPHLESINFDFASEEVNAHLANLKRYRISVDEGIRRQLETAFKDKLRGLGTVYSLATDDENKTWQGLRYYIDLRLFPDKYYTEKPIFRVSVYVPKSDRYKTTTIWQLKNYDLCVQNVAKKGSGVDVIRKRDDRLYPGEWGEGYVSYYCGGVSIDVFFIRLAYFYSNWLMRGYTPFPGLMAIPPNIPPPVSGINILEQMRADSIENEIRDYLAGRGPMPTSWVESGGPPLTWIEKHGPVDLWAKNHPPRVLSR